jgi:hypothetical protein
MVADAVVRCTAFLNGWPVAMMANAGMYGLSHRGAERRAPAARRTRRVGGGRRLKMVAGTGLGEEGTVVGR